MVSAISLRASPDTRLSLCSRPRLKSTCSLSWCAKWLIPWPRRVAQRGLPLHSICSQPKQTNTGPIKPAFLHPYLFVGSAATRAAASAPAKPRKSGGVPFFEVFNLALCFLFRVIHGLARLLPVLCGLLGSGFLVRFVDLLGCILGIAPGFFHRTLGLIDHSFVG